MVVAILVTVVVLFVIAAIVEVITLSAPEGYEDESGFHYSDPAREQPDQQEPLASFAAGLDDEQ